MTAAAAAWVIQPLDHRDAQVADQIGAVWGPASEQEARLLGPDALPPPGRSACEIQRSGDFHLGARDAGVLAGVIAIGPDSEAGHLAISALVVDPQRQRRGIGSALLAETLRRGAGMAFTVTTAAANGPALALYAAHGFRPWRHGTLGATALPMVKLRRPP